MILLTLSRLWSHHKPVSTESKKKKIPNTDEPGKMFLFAKTKI